MAEKEKLENLDSHLLSERVIFLVDEVTEGTALDISKHLIYFNQTSDPVTMIINSPGGGIPYANHIISMMEYVKCPIVTVGMGRVMSCGLMIFMAGTDRRLTRCASVLSHRFWTIEGGDHAELFAGRKHQDMTHELMIKHYIKHSTLCSRAEVERHLLRESNVFLSPTEAQAYGLCDRVVDFRCKHPPVRRSAKTEKFLAKMTQQYEVSDPEMQGRKRKK